MTNTENEPSTSTSRRYVVITPCRDEEDHLEATIRTVVEQSVPPALWVIVDDGSTDETPRILADAENTYSFIKIVTRNDRGARKVGPGVIEAFYAGLEHVDLSEFTYVCKLDADLELPPLYFQTLIEKMETDPLLGNFSGKVYLREPDGRLIPERMGDENAIGAAKFYRIGCFQDIGGFVREVSWDGIDGHLCRMHGWIAGSSDEEPLRIIHRRLMGSSEMSIWEGRKRWGRGKYYMGSAWYFVLAVACYRLFERPFIIGGLGILYGYLKEVSTGSSTRFSNLDYRKHLRAYELRSLITGKRRTLLAFNRRIRRRFADVTKLPNRQITQTNHSHKPSRMTS